jgi:hypothetical protein
VGLTTITRVATGPVSFTSFNDGLGTPDGHNGGLWQHFTGPGGVENGIAQIAPTEISSLIGVWYDVDTHTGIPFFMGSSGSAAVPAGYDELYPGTMDGFKWYDNSGEFRVEVNPDRSVPEGGSFTAFYPAAGALMGGSVVRKLRNP